jgi:hypothetical protein
MSPLAEFSIDIEAPLAVVWRVMTAFEQYPAWNPFIVGVRCDDAAPRVGSRVLLDVAWDNGGRVRSPEVISQLEPPAGATGEERATLAYTYASWIARLNLVRGTRVQTLAVGERGGTRWHTRERFAGWLVAGVPLARVQDGFERHGRALKRRAEALA